MRMLGNNLWDSVLYFHYVAPKDRTQISGLLAEHSKTFLQLLHFKEDMPFVFMNLVILLKLMPLLGNKTLLGITKVSKSIEN